MDLNKLVPKAVNLKLKMIEQDLTLSPLTIGRYLDIEDKVGNIEAIIGKPSLDDICRLAFILLSPKSKSLFKKRMIEDIDIDGNPVEVELGGYKLFMNHISNTEEQIALYKAVLQAMGWDDSSLKSISKKKRSKKK